MRYYKATIPMHTEFASEYDQHDSSTLMEFRFETSVHIENMYITMLFPDLGNSRIIIENICAETEVDAFKIVVDILPVIVNAVCLKFQRQNINQHYGHIRVKWYKGQIDITPRDQSISTSLGTKIIINFDTTGLQEIISNAWFSEELKFLLQAYYGSLQAQDYRAKYYHAFTIIEYIENKYKDEVGTKRFKESDCLYMGNEIYKLLELKEYLAEDCNSGRESIINLLRKMTKESRSNKLLQIITENIDIKSIKYLEDIQVDKNLVDKFIDIRNKLFHAGNEVSEIKKYTDILILVCQQIVWSFSLKGNGA